MKNMQNALLKQLHHIRKEIYKMNMFLSPEVLTRAYFALYSDTREINEKFTFASSLDSKQVEDYMNKFLIERINQKITKELTLEELYLFFEQDELDTLALALNTKVRFDWKNDREEMSTYSLITKLFLEEVQTNYYTVPSHLVDIARKLVEIKPTNEQEIIREICQLIKGILYLSGYISVKDVKTVIKNFDERYTNDLIAKSINTYFVRHISGLKQEDFRIRKILGNPYPKDMAQKILYNLSRIDNQLSVDKISKEEILRYAKLQHDENENMKKYQNELLKHTKTKNFQYYECCAELINATQLLEDKQVVQSKLLSKLKINKEDAKQLEKLREDAYNSMRTPSLGGRNINEFIAYLHEEEKRIYRNEKNRDYYMNEDDIELYLKVLYTLFDYYNQKFKILPGLKEIHNVRLLPQGFSVELLELIADNKNLIKNFVKDNPYDLNDEELQVANDFRNLQMLDCVVAKYENGYTYLVDTNSNVYLIKGIRRSLIDSPIRKNQKISPILFPFKGNIVVFEDVAVLPEPISATYKKNIKKALQDESKFIYDLTA